MNLVLRASDDSEHGPILLDIGSCPLIVQSVESESITGGERIVDARGRLQLALTPVATLPRWDKVRLHMRLLWSPETPVQRGAVSSAGGILAPCLVLPDMLPEPRMAARLIDDGPPPRLPRLYFEAELPSGLSAGGISMPGRSGDPSPELLQTVIFRTAPVRGAVDESDDLAVCAADAASPSQARLESAFDMAQQLIEFIKGDLGFAAPVRPVICIGADVIEKSGDLGRAEPYAPTGAYCPVAAEEAWATETEKGKDVLVATILAHALLGSTGGGVRVWGENAVELAMGVGGALGLRWLQTIGSNAALARALAVRRDKVARAESTGEWSPSLHAMALQIPLCHGLQSRRNRRRLGRLLKRHWGHFIPQDLLVQELRRWGIRVPHVFT